MTDPHLDDALSAFLDDELAPAANCEVDEHLRRCPACRAELAGLAAVRAAVRDLPIHGERSWRWPSLLSPPRGHHHFPDLPIEGLQLPGLPSWGDACFW
jgi:hypothetical protein